MDALLDRVPAEIATELTQSFELSPTQRLAATEAARCVAILKAIDRDLDERGLEDKAGKPRYLLNHRWRVSRQLHHWLGKIADAIERQSAAGHPPPAAGRAEYVRELERIALGNDPHIVHERIGGDVGRRRRQTKDRRRRASSTVTRSSSGSCR